METQSKLRQAMEEAGKKGYQVDVKKMPNGNSKPVKQFKDLTDVEKAKLAMDHIRNQPGRPSKEIMLKQLQAKGMTRAQAKEEIKRFDGYMVKEFLTQMEKTEMEKSVSPERVKPLVGAMFRGMGFQA